MFNRFNKPKKIIQKGGAKTAIEIKEEFLNKIRDEILKNDYKKTKDNFDILGNNLLKLEEYRNLRSNGYIFFTPTLKENPNFAAFVGTLDPNLINSVASSLTLFYKNKIPITDEELLRLVPDVATPPDVADSPLLVPPAPASAAALTEEQQFYMNFRNEIKERMDGKPCNDETIGEAGKQLMATKKYENFAKQYEFNESYFLDHNGGKFLHWFCSVSDVWPENGFPITFIPLRSNTKGILAAYNEPYTEAEAEAVTEAKVGNGVLGYGTVGDVAAVGTAATAAAAAGAYYFNGKPTQPTDKSDKSESASTDGSGSSSTGSDASSGDLGESSTGSAEITDGSGLSSDDSLTSEQKQEKAFEIPPEGWEKKFLRKRKGTGTNRPFLFKRNDGSETWMRTIENGLPIWIRRTATNIPEERLTDKEFFDKFYPHEKTIEPPVKQQNNTKTNPPPPPPPSPPLQLPVTSSFSGQDGVWTLAGNNTESGYHPNISSIGGPQPQVTPRFQLRGSQPSVDTTTYAEKGAVTLAGFLALFLYRKLLNRGAASKNLEEEKAPAEAAEKEAKKAAKAAAKKAAEAAEAATRPPVETDEARERREAIEAQHRETEQQQAAEQQRQLEAEQQREQNREKREQAKQEHFNKFIEIGYDCSTIVNQAKRYLSSLLKKDYAKAPKTFVKLKDRIIAHIVSVCPDTDVSDLQKLSIPKQSENAE